MFSFLKKRKKTKDSEALQGLLEIFYFPPLDPIPFESIDDDTRTKVLLFSYGVYDAYCQAARISNDKASQILSQIDDFVQSAVGASLSEFVTTKTYKAAFEDDELLKVIEFGGKTYGDFASKDKERGGLAIARLGRLVNIWER